MQCLLLFLLWIFSLMPFNAFQSSFRAVLNEHLVILKAHKYTIFSHFLGCKWNLNFLWVPGVGVRDVTDARLVFGRP